MVNDLSKLPKLRKLDLSFLINAYKDCPNKDDFLIHFLINLLVIMT